MSSSKIQKFRLREACWPSSNADEVRAVPLTQPRFGPIVQNAFVVHDMEARWRTGAQDRHRSFYLLEHVAFGPVHFRGAPLTLDMSVAIAQWGPFRSS